MSTKLEGMKEVAQAKLNEAEVGRFLIMSDKYWTRFIRSLEF